MRSEQIVKTLTKLLLAVFALYFAKFLDMSCFENFSKKFFCVHSSLHALSFLQTCLWLYAPWIFSAQTPARTGRNTTPRSITATSSSSAEARPFRLCLTSRVLSTSTQTSCIWSWRQVSARFRMLLRQIILSRYRANWLTSCWEWLYDQKPVWSFRNFI